MIFEDKKDSLLSQFFRAAYIERVSKNFEYTGGNQNILPLVEDMLQKTKDRMFIFLDSPPDNEHIKRIFNKLRALSKQHDYQIVVFNIVCAEYYFLKSYGRDSRIINMGEGIDIALKIDDYRNSSLIQTDKDRKLSKNFEGFCKLILLKNFKDCARNSRGEDGNNSEYGYFYTEDCPCVNQKADCYEQSLVDKATVYVDAYPCIPMSTIKDIKAAVTEEGIWEIHRKLVDEYNASVIKYGKLGVIPENEINKYKITYIK